MNKKWLLVIILVLTFLAITTIVILKKSKRYNKLIINEDKCNSIIESKNESTSIYLESIEFNDYELIIDNKNNLIYYSIVETSKKYNPSVKYKTNKKTSIVINKNITDDIIEDIDSIKVMIYNNEEYRIYSLVVTNYPTLNVIYDESDTKNNKTPIELEIFDNHTNSTQRLLKSKGKFRVIEENNIYSFSLFMESLGNNKRDNHISIFGMEKRDEYILKKAKDVTNDDKYVRLFINNEYFGLYSLSFKNKNNIYEINKANNN